MHKLEETNLNCSTVPELISYKSSRKHKCNENPLQETFVHKCRKINSNSSPTNETKKKKKILSYDYFDNDLDDNAMLLAEKTIQKKYYRMTINQIFVDLRTHTKLLEATTDDKDELKYTIELKEDWFECLICRNDIVHVIGSTIGNCDINFLQNENFPIIIDPHTAFIIDNKHNYIVIAPDYLMIPSRIASSFQCIRKELLAFNIKQNSASHHLLYGTMAHELFQYFLVQKNMTQDIIQSKINRIVSKYFLQIYLLNQTEQQAKLRLSKFIPQIISFFGKYFNTTKNATVDWSIQKKSLQIGSVLDIEENIWSPMFGICGSIDATLKVKVNECIELLPFELKTGKESIYSKMSARAQLTLYSLLIADKYDTNIENISGGLLFYLKTGNLMGIPIPHNEIRALLIRRNFLTKHFCTKPIVDIENNLIVQQKQLPAMLDIHQKQICLKGCFYKNECFLFHKIQCYQERIIDVSNKNVSSTNEYAQSTSHLNEIDTKYMSKWMELIDLEQMSLRNTRHEIWTMSSVERETKNGKCLSNMMISDCCRKDASRVIYTFIKHPDYNETTNIELWNLKFKLNHRIVISDEHNNKYAILKGNIIELNVKYIKIASHKKLKDLKIIYRLDLDDAGSYTYATMRRNVLNYFYPGNQQNKIKKLLVELIPPTYDINCKLNIPNKLKQQYKLLNIDQQNAIKHVIQAKDYALILGMPGTGKSTVIVFLLRLLTHMQYKIMLCSYTNSAVDHLCFKLLQYEDIKHKFIRIGNPLSINSKLNQHTLDNFQIDSITQLNNYLKSKNIFCVTSTSATSHFLFSCKDFNTFDYCIIDEAGQLTEPDTLGPLSKCHKFLLVGDNNQLPPLVQSTIAKSKGLEISLFERLAKQFPDTAVKLLTIQYRMNANILTLTNSLIYNEKMKCASNEVAEQSLKYKFKIKCQSRWLQYTLEPKHSVVLLNSDAFENNNENKQNVNEFEATIIQIIINNLFKMGIYPSQIGVMAPYRSQLQLIENKLNILNMPQTNDKYILLDTIDRFQGSDKDVIIISFTNSKFDTKVKKIVHDWRRLNVALTRAKQKLILIASVHSFTNSASTILHKLAKLCDQKKWIYNLSVADINDSV